MLKLQKFNQLGILTSIHYFIQQFFLAVKPFATSRLSVFNLLMILELSLLYDNILRLKSQSKALCLVLQIFHTNFLHQVVKYTYNVSFYLQCQRLQTKVQSLKCIYGRSENYDSENKDLRP